MNGKSRFYRFLWNTFVYAIVSVLVLFAIALTLARIYLPTASQYKDDIELWVSKALKQQLEIDTLSADWRGIEPQLVLDGVRLFNSDKTKLITKFDKAKIGVDLIDSLRHLAFMPGAVVIDGAALAVSRSPEGSFSIAGVERETSSPSAGDSELLSNWLMGQRLIKLENSVLKWRDEAQANGTQVFQDVNLTLRNRGDRHQIEGSIVLPRELGQQLVVFADLRGDVIASTSWSGNVYVSAVGVDVKNWLRVPEYKNVMLEGGTASVGLWSRWQSARLQDVRGGLNINKLAVRSTRSAKLIEFENVSTDIALEQRQGEWRITGEQFSVQTRGHTWPMTQFDVRFNSELKKLEAEISYLDIEDLLQLVSLADTGNQDVNDFLSRSRPEGQLRNLSVYANGAKEHWQFAVTSRFEELGMNAWRKIPGFTNLAGNIELSNKDGAVKLDSRDWILDHPLMFDGKPEYDYLTGGVSWRKTPSGWWVAGAGLEASDGNATAKGRFTLDIDQDQQPFLDLVLSLKGHNINSPKKYLPSAMMPSAAVSWIEGALKGGSITRGNLLYHGRLKHYPFEDGDGKFNLNLIVKGGVLKYLPQWPEIKGINGELDVTQSGLTFHADRGLIYRNEITGADVSIPDFRAEDRMLLINGKVTGSTDEKLKYMHESPLEQIFARHLQAFRASGDSDLDLDLKIPLVAGGALSVEGQVHMKNNRLNAEPLKLDFQNIDTVLSFNEKGISSDKLKAKLGPIDIDSEIETVEVGEERRIIFSQATDVEQDVIQYVFENFVGKPHWANYIDGKSFAQIAFIIPVKTDTPEAVLLQVVSDTYGLGVNLPYPLTKSKDEVQRLVLQAELSGDQRQISLDIESINLLLQFALAGSQLQLERGGVGMGVPASLPGAQGFQFSGDLERFYWSEWQPLLFPEEGVEPLMGKGGGPSSIFFDVSIKDLELFGIGFTDTKLQVSNTSQGWIIHANGPEVAGSVYIPLVWTSAPLVLDMERLYVQTGGGDRKDSTLDPLLLPETKIKSKDFRFNGMNFGQLDLDAVRAPNGLRLKKLSMNTRDARIQAKGHWKAIGGEQLSDFDIKISALNFGHALRDWGYKNLFESGSGELNIKAQWPGAPTDFTFSTLTGDMDINISKTRLLDINVGALKMFNLFSLETIPRRLALDFSDVVTKGVSFDNVIGKFSVQNGDAFTSGTILSGPTARLQMAGRVGLGNQDYDLVVTFVSRALESIPLLGALTASNPPLGLTLFVMQKLFQTQVDELSAVQYTVTGDWKQPKMLRVKAQGDKTPEFFDE